MRPDIFEQFASDIPQRFLRKLRQQKCKEQRCQFDHIVGVGAAVQDLVVLVDLGLEGGVLRDEMEQLRVLRRGLRVDGIEYE